VKNPAYALPHLLQRDSGGAPPKDILIIGAGSGNDVSRALQWAGDDVHIDAVEIDPVIRRLGDNHPNRPYADPRVTTHITDGRNFLRATDRKYDLVIFALVDSLVLHSGYSSIRLESYLFTHESFKDVKARLKPEGRLVMYNFFREGWIVARLKEELEEVFGKGNPLVMMLPSAALFGDTDPQPPMETMDPDTELYRYFTLFIAGETDGLKKAFAASEDGLYRLPVGKAPTPALGNGFHVLGDVRTGWQHYGLTRVNTGSLRTTTDDWPFLYLREPMMPWQPTISGMVMVAVISLVLLFLFMPRPSVSNAESRFAFDGRMFFLGAGFMLVETRAVVHMALLFGSTWMVNTVVFAAVLVMILFGNLLVHYLKRNAGGDARHISLAPFYIALLLALIANALIPLDFFLGLSRPAQLIGSCVLLMAPLFFAAVIFAVSFARTAQTDRAFGMNIAGAMLGGIAENVSVIMGFQHLILVATAFYLLSMLWRKAATTASPEPAFGATAAGTLASDVPA
jgi:hypothetical protein